MLETQDHLARTLSPERMQDRVNYMEGSKYFQAMCAGMSQEELKKLALEGGEKLCKKYAETQAAMKEAARQKEEAAQANRGQDGPQEERVKGDPVPDQGRSFRYEGIGRDLGRFAPECDDHFRCLLILFFNIHARLCGLISAMLYRRP